MSERKIAIVGGCECGIAYIETPDSIDSGSTFRCEAGHPIVFDVASPQARAELFSHKETVQLRAENERLGRQIKEMVDVAKDWRTTYRPGAPDSRRDELFDLARNRIVNAMLTVLEAK